MRKFISLVGTLLVCTCVPSTILATDFSTRRVEQTPEPSAVTSVEKAEVSGFVMQSGGKFLKDAANQQSGTVRDKRRAGGTRSAAIGSVSDLVGEYVQFYSTLVTPCADGGKGVTIDTVDDDPEAIKIINFYDVGLEVKADVDLAAGTISIANQDVLDSSTLGVLDIAVAVVGSDGLPAPDRSQCIEGVINDDGSITLTSWWGIFGTEGANADKYAGIFHQTEFLRANATMTQKSLSAAPFTYSVIAEQTSPNILSVRNFGNYGMTVEILLDNDRTASISSQIARMDNYGDNYYTNAITYTSSGQVTEFSGTIVAEKATDSRTVAWKDWTMTNSTSYLGILTDGSVSTTFDIEYPALAAEEFEGDGTQTSPYLIKSRDDLLLLAKKVNSATPAEYNATTTDGVGYYAAFSGEYFRMEADIDMDGYRLTPIGNDWYHHFDGTFDGNGHKITGLDISTGDAGYAALFGRAGAGSTIKDLTVEKPVVRSQGSFAAAIVGWSDGAVDNCHVMGADIANQGRTTGGIAGIVVTITNSTIDNSVVIGLGGNTGGLASEVDKLVENCNATEMAVVVYAPAETYPSGGLTATLYNATARNCYFSGTVDGMTYNQGGYLGGITGTCYRGIIENCFSVGQIAGTGQNVAVGGLVGSHYGSIKNSYSAGVVSNAASVKTGGLVGTVGFYQTDDGVTVQSTIAGCYSVSSVVAFVSGYDAANESREIIGQIQQDASPGITNIYFDRQICNFGSERYGVNTSELTGAAGVAGFDATVWNFTAGQYPRLKGLDENEAAYMGASVIDMGESNSLNKIAKDVDLRPMGSTEYLLYRDGNLVPEGYFCSIVGDNIQIKDDFGTDTLIVRNGNTSYPLFLHIAPIPYEGEGTEQNPFLLKTKEDILTLQDITNNKGQYFAGTYFKLADDIDMEYDETFVGICFDPAASSERMFAGIFDGDGHAITRLALDKVVWTTRPEDDATGKGGKPDNLASTQQGAYSGFFGRVGVEGVVRNLTIAADARLSLWSASGAIAGDNYGRIENCRNYADVTGYSNHIGGIVGRNLKGGVVSGCYNAGNVLSGYQYAGGISGMDQGSIENCVNVGNITVDEISQAFAGTKMRTGAGGIVGFANGSVVRNVVNAGTIYAAGGRAGGIAGSFDKITHTSGSGKNDMSQAINYGMVSTVETTSLGALAGYPGTQGDVRNNYFDAQILAVGPIGNADMEGMAGVETSVLVSGTPLEGFDAEVWDFTAGLYPVINRFADEEKIAKARCVIVSMETGVTAKNMSRDARLSEGDGLTWSLRQQDAFVIEGNTLCSPEEVEELVVDTVVAVWDDYVKMIEIRRAPNVPLPGSGTAEDPYRISTAEDWNNLADYMASIAESFEGRYLKVMSDIDFTDKEFKMLAYDGVTVFDGSLDGDGKRISGIAFTPTGAGQGAICTVGEVGSVANLTLAGDVETAMASTGGFTGEVYGTLINCVSEINVTSTKGNYVSGFGELYTTARLTDCINKGSISGTGTNIAGLAAEVANGVQLVRCGNEGMITNNAKGNYTAGLIGTANPIRMEECYNKGTVTVTDVDNTKNVAGLVAYATATASSTGSMELIKCWNEGDVTGTAVVAGLIAATTSTTSANNPLILTECYNTGTITAYSTKTQDSTSSPTAGLVAFYNIGSQFTDCYNAGTVNSTNQYAAGIAAYPKANIPEDNPVTFDGCYNVGDVLSTANHAAGLIGYIKDFVTVTNGYNTARIEGAYGVGGIVGRLDGVASVVKDTWNSGSVVSSLNRVGGIYGYGSGGTVENCFNVGAVTSTSAEKGTAANSSGYAVGGIAGQGGASFVNCYNTGEVTGASQVGGLIGTPVKDVTRVVRCFNAGNIVADADTCGALIGVNLANGKLWTVENSVTDSYFVTDYGTYANSSVGTAITIVGLAALEDMGEGWTPGDAYTLPMVSSLATVPEALINAVTVGFATGDSKDLVTQDFFVGAPEGVTWMASVPNITFSGMNAVFSSEAFEGEAVLTVMAGDLSREFTIYCDKRLSGIGDIVDGKTVTGEIWFNAKGVCVPEPTYRDGTVYLVVRTYSDGSVETIKVFNVE